MWVYTESQVPHGANCWSILNPKSHAARAVGVAQPARSTNRIIRSICLYSRIPTPIGRVRVLFIGIPTVNPCAIPHTVSVRRARPGNFSPFRLTRHAFPCYSWSDSIFGPHFPPRLRPTDAELACSVCDFMCNPHGSPMCEPHTVKISTSVTMCEPPRSKISISVTRCTRDPVYATSVRDL